MRGLIMHRSTTPNPNTLLTAAPSGALAPAAQSHGALVICLCAQWCGVCRDYRATFEQLAADFAGTRFIWLDVEDQAELVDDLEVENFPTLLLAAAGQPVFFGPITPHADTLRRLLQSHVIGVAPRPLADPQLAKLVTRLALIA